MHIFKEVCGFIFVLLVITYLVFRYHDEIESTNVEAKSLALKGAPEGTVVVAEAQSAGRGRLGRRWTSPAGKGLLLSVILRPQLPMSEAHMLTIVAATAAADPPDEPPATRDGSCGLRVGPKAEFSVEPPMANSSMFVRPIKTAPHSLCSLLITVASYGA